MALGRSESKMPANGLENDMFKNYAAWLLKGKWVKFTTHLVIAGFAVGLLFLPSGSTAATPEMDIRGKIDRFVQGLQQQNIDKVVSIFKPDAMWLGRNIHNQVQASTAAIVQHVGSYPGSCE